MKQMTKEELIEYFIEQLGDNEILGEIMSIEQIRTKLNNIIRDVTYKDEVMKGADASWRIQADGKGIVNFDLKKMPDNGLVQKKIIVHELLHALSANLQKYPSGLQIEKCGLRNNFYVHLAIVNETDFLENHNEAINEGMTDTLAEMITGVTVQNGYDKERDIYKIVSIMVGKEAMFKKFFSDKALDTRVTTNTFKKELIAKYGDKLGAEINRGLRKVLQLSDLALNLKRRNEIDKLGELGKKIQGKIDNGIYKTLENMMMKVIENEPDIMKKVQDILVPGRFTGLNEKIVNKILSEVLENKDVDAKTMLGTFRLVRRECYSDKTSQILDQMLLRMPDLKKELDDKFENLDKSNMTTEEIMQEYMTIYSGCKEWMDIEKVYNWYAELGKVIPGQEFKRGVFKRIFTDDKAQLDQRIADTKYRKIGDYYQIIEDGKPSQVLIDEKGKAVSQRFIDFNHLSEDKIEDATIRRLLVPENLSEEKGEALCAQIKQISLELEAMNTTNAKLEYGLFRAHGNLLEIQRRYKDNEPIKVYYKIQEDGTLEKVEMRTRKKIYR